MNLFYQSPAGTVNGEKQPKSMAKMNSIALCICGFDDSWGSFWYLKMGKCRIEMGKMQNCS